MSQVSGYIRIVMADQFSSEEFSDLVVPTSSSGESDRFEAPMSYDFKRPRGVGQETLRLLDSVHEQFAGRCSGTLSSALRLATDVELAHVDQVAYGEFVHSMATPSNAYSFEMNPPGSAGVLSLSPNLTMAAIDRAFGGKGLVLPGEPRALTQIEAKVIQKLVSGMITDLEAAWEPILQLQISDLAFESNPELIRVAAHQDQVFLIGFEAHFARASGLLHLCYPLHTLSPLLRTQPGTPARSGPAKARVHPPETGQPSQPSHSAVTPALRNTRVAVAIEVARGRLPTEEVAKLRSGDIIKLDTLNGEPAVVFIGQQPKFLGRPGLSGQRRAVEIVATIGPDQEPTYR